MEHRTSDGDASGSAVETVEIIKQPGQTLGFYIREGDGRDRETGLFISRIAGGSVVARNGMLRINDEILTVNSVDVTRMRLDDVVVLMSIAKCLVLTVRSRKPQTFNAIVPRREEQVDDECRRRQPVVVLKSGFASSFSSGPRVAGDGRRSPDELDSRETLNGGRREGGRGLSRYMLSGDGQFRARDRDQSLDSYFQSKLAAYRNSERLCLYRDSVNGLYGNNKSPCTGTEYEIHGAEKNSEIVHRTSKTSHRHRRTDDAATAHRPNRTPCSEQPTLRRGCRKGGSLNQGRVSGHAFWSCSGARESENLAFSSAHCSSDSEILLSDRCKNPRPTLRSDTDDGEGGSRKSGRSRIFFFYSLPRRSKDENTNIRVRLMHHTQKDRSKRGCTNRPKNSGRSTTFSINAVTNNIVQLLYLQHCVVI